MFCLKTAADGCETPLPAVLGLPRRMCSIAPTAACRSDTQTHKPTSENRRSCTESELNPRSLVYTGKKPETGNVRRRSACPNPQGILSRTKLRSGGAPCAGYEPAHNGKVLSCIQQLTAHSASTSAGRSTARNPHGESGALSAATGSRGHGLLHQAAP